MLIATNGPWGYVCNSKHKTFQASVGFERTCYLCNTGTMHHQLSYEAYTQTLHHNFEIWAKINWVKRILDQNVKLHQIQNHDKFIWLTLQYIKFML